MKSLLNYISEKQNFLIKGHINNQKEPSYTIPTSNFDVNKKSEELVQKYQGECFELNYGEFLSYTSDYFDFCIKKKITLPIEMFVEDYIGFLELGIEDIDSDANKEITKVFSEFIKQNFVKK